DFDGGRRRVLRHGDRELDLDRLSGVWYRRPTGFDFGPDMPEPERLFARKEAMQAIGGILRATDCLGVNRPDIDAIGELKPYQLELARRLGLRVPRTLLTNDPQEVAGLLERADTKI